jgi:HNH endonuclease
VPSYIPAGLKTQIEQRDRHRCCYCQTQSANNGMPMSLDHILPTSKGGKTVFENVCLACRSCNEFKSDVTEATDPLTGKTAPLFNPRQQTWSDHFIWSEDGSRIQGLSDIGRATVVTLQMNNPAVVIARRRWVSGGWHPPLD